LGDNKLIIQVEKKAATITEWYKAAVDLLVKMHKAKPMKGARKYAPRDWFAETARFIDWYFPLATGRAATLAERAEFMALWQPLYERVMQGPLGTMMWDFQSTNIMILGSEPKAENIGLVDIQDARTAPVAQDLAILLRDIRRVPDAKLEREIVAYAAKQLKLKAEDMQLWLDITGLHHACRIIGGLARSILRDNKPEGAKRFLARTWETANQSKGCKTVKEIFDFIGKFERPGLAAIETKKKAA
jgi:aminoglycoside/choline kinase family phosphotransferase